MMTERRIESAENPQIKKAKKLLERKGREQAGAFLIEGKRLVEDALRHGAQVTALFVADGAEIPEMLRTGTQAGVRVTTNGAEIPEMLRAETQAGAGIEGGSPTALKEVLAAGATATTGARLAGDGAAFSGAQCEVFRLPERLFSTLKTTINSQGILGIVQNLDRKIQKNCFEHISFSVYLDCVSDPGNLGTIIRTADAAGAQAVVLSKGCVDLYNPKVVRSTMASLFAVPVYREDTYGEGLDALLDAGFCAVAGSLEARESCFDADLTEKCTIVVGNEANGVSDAILERCDRKVIIPMRGGAESLNAAVACGVLMYEYVRQNRRMD